MDILICKLTYPNDVTQKSIAHQHFVGYYESNSIILYSISSLQGKEKRVFNSNGGLNQEYFLLKGTEMHQCRLKMPSFINCSTSFKISIDSTVDINCLSHRSMPGKIRLKIEEKIEELKQIGLHTEYSISLSEFKHWNYKCVIDRRDSSINRNNK